MDHSAVLLYGIILNDDEFDHLFGMKSDWVEEQKCSKYELIEDTLLKDGVILTSDDEYFYDSDQIILGKELASTDQMEIVKREDFFCIGPELILKIRSIYKEIFQKELDNKRLQLILLERVW